jgi:hypothetical protein
MVWILLQKINCVSHLRFLQDGGQRPQRKNWNLTLIPLLIPLIPRMLTNDCGEELESHPNSCKR